MQTRCPGVAAAEKNYLKTENNFEALLIEFAVVLTATCGSQWVWAWVHICVVAESIMRLVSPSAKYSYSLCDAWITPLRTAELCTVRNLIRDFDISAKILALCCAGIRDLYKLKLRLKQNKWLQWEMCAVTASQNDFRWRSFGCKPHTCTESASKDYCVRVILVSYAAYLSVALIVNNISDPRRYV